MSAFGLVCNIFPLSIRLGRKGCVGDIDFMEFLGSGVEPMGRYQAHFRKVVEGTDADMVRSLVHEKERIRLRRHSSVAALNTPGL